MSAFDLNILNYNINELENMLELNKGYNKTDVILQNKKKK